MVNNLSVHVRVGGPIIVAIVVALAAAGGIWYWSLSRQPVEPPGITPEGKAYVRNLQLSSVEMKATESFAGAAVVEITGNITNAGDRTLDRVELTCVFYDPYGQEVLRERVPIVRSTTAPGETRSFRLAFDNIPNTWNQAMPNMVIAHVAFAE